MFRRIVFVTCLFPTTGSLARFTLWLFAHLVLCEHTLILCGTVALAAFLVVAVCFLRGGDFVLFRQMLPLLVTLFRL